MASLDITSHIERTDPCPSCVWFRRPRFALSRLSHLQRPGAAHAQSGVEIALSYKDKKFDPPEISAPANTPIVIKFRNLDKDAMELESKTR